MTINFCDVDVTNHNHDNFTCHDESHQAADNQIRLITCSLILGPMETG
jgi:hypothetical protein